MATIITINRSINVKESIYELFNNWSHQWIDVTELISCENLNGDFTVLEVKKTINKEYIIEIRD